MPALLEVGIQLLGALSPLIVSGMGWLAVRVSQLVAARTGSEQAGQAILKLNYVATTVVTELEQTMVAAAKARSNGGKLNQADIDAIKTKALEKLRTYLGADGLKLIAKAFNLDDQGLTTFLAGKIESVVYAVGQGVVPDPAGGASVLPPFYPSSPAHPAQQALGLTTPGVSGR